MQLTSQSVKFAKEFRGVVVRPPSSSSTSAPQTLVFFQDEIHELLKTYTGGTTGAGKTFWLSAQPLAVAGQFSGARSPVYDPTSDCVFFNDGDYTTIKRLDRNNTVSLVAGRDGERGNVDGPGESARFRSACSLAADGKGHVFIADDNVIRVLDVRTGGVGTLPGSTPVSGYWFSISYDAAVNVLVASTQYAVCHIPVVIQCSGGGVAASSATLRLSAGSWSEGGRVVDGIGTAARFHVVASVLVCAGGTVLIGDGCRLRSMDASRAVTTINMTPGFFSCVCSLAFLPGGELACTGYSMGLDIISGGGGLFAPSSEALAGRIPATHGSLAAAAASDLLDFLLTPPGCEGGNTSVATVTINTVRAGGDGAGGDGKSFTAHRSVLMARSEYFRTLLAVGGPFADSGATELSLPDKHPEAFGHLLSYMYTGTIVVPDELLRPAAELARRLLLPADCIAQLQARLMAAVAPESVVSDLVWAAQYGMDELVPQLRAYLLRHRREVAGAGADAKEGLSALAATHPDLAGEMMMEFLRS